MEKHEKSSKGWLVAAILFWSAALVLLIVMISCIAIKEPPMTDPDWIDVNARKTLGIVFSALGMALSIVIGFILLARYNRWGQRVIQSGVKTVTGVISSIREAANPTKPAPEKYYCKYCGALLGEGDLFCSSCGARKTQKTNN